MTISPVLVRPTLALSLSLQPSSGGLGGVDEVLEHNSREKGTNTQEATKEEQSQVIIIIACMRAYICFFWVD
jgi:hypothetical protein